MDLNISYNIHLHFVLLYRENKKEHAFEKTIEKSAIVLYYIFKEFRTCVFAGMEDVHMKTREPLKEQYPEMTNAEYLNEISKVLEEVKDNRLLRYFYIFISEKWKRVR